MTHSHSSTVMTHCQRRDGCRGVSAVSVEGGEEHEQDKSKKTRKWASLCKERLKRVWVTLFLNETVDICNLHLCNKKYLRCQIEWNPLITLKRLRSQLSARKARTAYPVKFGMRGHKRWQPLNISRFSWDNLVQFIHFPDSSIYLLKKHGISYQLTVGKGRRQLPHAVKILLWVVN